METGEPMKPDESNYAVITHGDTNCVVVRLERIQSWPNFLGKCRVAELAKKRGYALGVVGSGRSYLYGGHGTRSAVRRSSEAHIGRLMARAPRTTESFIR